MKYANSNNQTGLPTTLLPWMMWVLTLSFFAFQFILRLFPGLMMPQIMQQFSIDATAFGFLSAMYYFGYAGMQIPVAILLDRYGPRLVVSACALVCGLSTLIFLYTNNWLIALLGRFLIGASSAAGFLGTSKIVSMYFPRNTYARMIGYTFSFGLLGALYGGKPVNYLIEQWGWQSVLLGIACVAVCIACAVFLFGKNEKISSPTNESFSFNSLFQLFKKPGLLWLAFANLLMVGSLEGFADVWGVTYLMKAYSLTKGDAAGAVSFIFVGMLFGGPLLAYLSSKISSFYVISLSGLGMAGLFAVMLYLPNFINGYILCMLFFVVGVLCCYQVIVFAVGTDMVTPALAGITVAFLNSINMLGGSFFHTLIGSLLDLCWAGGMENGCRLYEVETYTYALLSIPATAALGAFIVGTLKMSEQRKA